MLKINTLGEWSCTPNSLGVGIYEAYLLEGLRLPLNAFAREFLHRLEIGPNQLNPNAWRTLMSMQVLQREAFNVNRPLTMDEFLYCYKPFKISQSTGFYQFLAMGSSCRLIRLLPSSNRRWRRSSSLSLDVGLETLLRQVGIPSLLTLVKWVVYVLRVCCLLLSHLEYLVIFV